MKLVVLLFLTACSVGEYGESPGGGGGGGGSVDASVGGGGGESSFNSMVKPLIASGSCVGCHAGTQPPNLTSFAALETKYKTKPGSANILVTKGPHQNIQYFTAAGASTVKDWIDSL